MSSSTAFAASAPLGARSAMPTAASRRSVDTPARLAFAPQRAARMSVITPETAKVLVGVYGVLIAGGGIGAYFKTKSAISAGSGLVSGALLAYAFSSGNIGLALFTACALTGVFGVRYAKTGKVMPSLVLCLVSITFAVLFGVSVFA